MQFNRAVALITGGAQGLGKAFAESLMKRGTKVIVADINPVLGWNFQQQSIDDFGPDSAKFLKCDVTDRKELHEVFEEAKATHGRLDIICNNAGIMTTDPSRARQQVDVNLTSVIEGTYKGIDLMSTQRGGEGGVIVNIASAAGLDLMMHAAVFSATKSAVVAFSRSFKRLRYFHEDEVRVNCVCPFFCDTNMLTTALNEDPENRKIIQGMGMVGIERVARGFMRAVESEELNGSVVVISPHDKVFEMRFTQAKM